MVESPSDSSTRRAWASELPKSRARERIPERARPAGRLPRVVAEVRLRRSAVDHPRGERVLEVHPHRLMASGSSPGTTTAPALAGPEPSSIAPSFAPCLAWATAWSLDRLRLWLERGMSRRCRSPAAIVHALRRSTLALVFAYHGLVPKLLCATPTSRHAPRRPRPFRLARGGTPGVGPCGTHACRRPAVVLATALAGGCLPGDGAGGHHRGHGVLSALPGGGVQPAHPEPEHRSAVLRRSPGPRRRTSAAHCRRSSSEAEP